MNTNNVNNPTRTIAIQKYKFVLYRMLMTFKNAASPSNTKATETAGASCQ